MRIDKLKLVNFRNYDFIEISFSENLNIIFGNNGSGKSNIVEAIYLLALTKSFRTNNEVNLIKNNKLSTLVSGKIVNDDINYYQVELGKDFKNVFIDNNKVNRLGDYISNINIILFNPLDTKIISETPNFRRKLLNIEISQINNEYLQMVNSYNIVLKHRNAYLKQLYINGNASSEYLDILTSKLITLGLKIHQIRKEFIESINQNIGDIYKKIFEFGTLNLKYMSTYEDMDEKKLKSLYQKNYQKEMLLGKTLYGVHLDDISFILDNINIREYGSVGQQKNAIISFRLAEILIVKKIKGYYPILILDDLFSELDNEKINNIIGMLNKNVQTFITTTNIDRIDEKLLKQSAIYKVENQIVERIE